MDDINQRKALFAQKIEDGRKIEVFTSMPEWQWYVEHVLKPTIYEHTDRIMKGKLKTDKEDWIQRGIVQGLQMVMDGTEGIKRSGINAKKAAKDLQEAQKEMEDE